jgi:hypothetical protein
MRDSCRFPIDNFANVGRTLLSARRTVPSLPSAIRAKQFTANGLSASDLVICFTLAARTGVSATHRFR